MTVLHAALLGVIQGLTEFLPVSSSAHLLLARDVFGWESDQFGLAFDVACHVGTLLAVVVYFRRELASMATSLPFMFTAQPDAPTRLLRRITMGTVPILLVGLALGDAIDSTMRTPGVAAVALAVGAVVLLTAERVGSQSRREDALTMVEALGLGLAQATAPYPGGLAIRRRRCGRRVGWTSTGRGGTVRLPPWCAAILAAAAREGVTLAGQGFSTDTLWLFAAGLATAAVLGT